MALPKNAAFFGRGTGPIVLDNIQCSGDEEFLVNCTASENPLFDNHGEDAGVQCFSGWFMKIVHLLYHSTLTLVHSCALADNSTNCDLGAMRLVGGANELEGRVEICLGGVWGSICDDFWSTQDASVACKQLNFSSQGSCTS